MKDLVITKKKKMIMVSAIAIAIVAIITLVYVLALNAQKSAAISEIQQLPVKTFIDFEKEEAAKRGYTSLPVPDATIPQETIKATVDQLVKNEIERLFATPLLEEKMKAAVAAARVVDRKGLPIVFTLKSGEQVQGRFKSKKSDRKEKFIVTTTDNKTYKMKSEITPAFYHLFDKDALPKHHVEIKKNLRKSFYEQKNQSITPLTQSFMNEYMRRAHYAYEGTSWMPVKQKIEQNAKMRYEGFLADYDKKANAILDTKTFLGSRFKLENLGIETPITPKK